MLTFVRTPVARLIAIIAAYLTLITLIIGIDRPAWSDEGHFVETVREFAERPIVDAVTDYRQVTPPLTFVVYGLWGRLFGTDLPTLRLLSVLIAAATHLLFGLLLLRSGASGRGIVTGLATFLLNPYTIGLSLFIFTDMLMVLFLIVVLHGVRRGSTVLMTVGMTLGLLTRQYFVFVVVAIAGLSAWQWSVDRSSVHFRRFGTAVVSCIPLFLLMTLWKGPAPPSGIAYWLGSEGMSFHPGAVTLYVGLSFAFLLPVVALRWRSFVFSRRDHVLLAAAGLLYWLVPVEPSAVTVAQTGRETVGLLHRSLIWLFGPVAAHAAFWVLFVGGLHMLWALVRQMRQNFTARQYDSHVLPDLLLLSFLVVLPLSYQVWEKYFVVLVPVLVLRILSLRPAGGRGPS